MKPNLPLPNLSTGELVEKGCECITESNGTGFGGFMRWYVQLPEDKLNTIPVEPYDLHDHDEFFGQDAYLFCSESIVNKLAREGKITPEQAASAPENAVTPHSSLQGFVTNLLNWILWLIASLGIWLLGIASYFLGQLLSIQQFTTHAMVQTGWPFILGVANLGFLLALLFVAFTTVLRIEGLQARRLLPKLLIAALLINFSLVISAVIIDASRLFMAVIVRLITDHATVDGIGYNILEKSGAIGSAFEFAVSSDPAGNTKRLIAVPGNSSWEGVLTTLTETFQIWILVIGFLFISVGLFFRYVMLILLLIVSPLAYLAIALPNTAEYAKRWWQTFLKYVFYGPAALFILLLIVVINFAPTGKDFLGRPTTSVFNNILKIFTTAVLAVASARIGTLLGIAGAAATVGFMKSLPGRAKRNKTATAGLLLAGPAGMLAGAALASKPGRRVMKSVGQRVYRSTGLKDVVEARKQYKEEKEKQRAEKSVLGRAARRYYRSTDEKKEEAEVKRLSGTAEGFTQMATNSGAFSAQNLVKPHVVAAMSALQIGDLQSVGNANQKMAFAAGLRSMSANQALIFSKEQIQAVIRTGDPNLVQNMVSNINIVRNMKDREKADVLAMGNAAITRELFKTLSKISAEKKK